MRYNIDLRLIIEVLNVTCIFMSYKIVKFNIPKAFNSLKEFIQILEFIYLKRYATCSGLAFISDGKK